MKTVSQSKADPSAGTFKYLDNVYGASRIPGGLGEASKRCKAIIAARQFQTLTCRASTVTTALYWKRNYSTPMGLPYPTVSDFAGRNWDHGPSKTQTQTQTKTQTLYLPGGKEKVRPWSKFPGRENSDHGLNFGLPRGGGRSCLGELKPSLMKGFGRG